jgi:nucleoside 2-deoxyribosyltransferase
MYDHSQTQPGPRRAYVATGLQRAKEARAMLDALGVLGFEPAYDWTVHGSVQGQGYARMAEVAANELAGVAAADIVVVMLPGGRGTHTEFGYALALGKKVFLVGPLTGADGLECAFYHAPGVLRFSEESDLISFIAAMLEGM